jgi:hypothetical protein
MAIPSWRAELPQSYAGAKKWGTGINPIHSQREQGDVGRNLAPGAYNGVALESAGLVDTGMEYGYTPEDLEMMGEGVDLSFMEAHPNLGAPDSHAQTGDFPSWGKGRYPIPQGTFYRALKIGMAWKEQIPQQQPSTTVSEGWTNKTHGEVNDAETSDPNQYEIWTSMRQRDLTKTNDSAVLRGTDDARSGIATRLTGIKVKNFSGGVRHEEMTPKEQVERPRPWLYRTAGTGPMFGVNDMYVSDPITREVPPDAYQGPTTAELATDDVWTEYY